MAFKLSVLDQSFARSADEATQALQETITMAQWCEVLGYERFWVSEHHAFPAVAGSAPEVLIAALGAATKTIRLGSGGIMLPHYSPYKVAEVFSLLGHLYPGRIDLGLGRAPGADMATAVALATDGKPKFEHFPNQVETLSNYLYSDNTKPIVSPKPPKDTPLWMLGSSADSAMLAAQRGLPYNLGVFINPQAEPALINYYKSNYQATSLNPTAYATLTMSVFCAEQEAHARALQLTYDINLFRFFTGQTDEAFLSPQEAQLYPINAQLRDFITGRKSTRAVGTPQQVKEKIESLVERYDVDEVMVVSNMHYLEDRKRCYQLLKEMFS